MRSFGRQREQRETTVPMDSISDIAFLLIIFFILATSIQRFAGFHAEIPAAERAQETEKTEKMPSVILRGGALMLNDKPVDMPQLRAGLLALQLPSKPENQRVVVVETSGSVPYQTYFEVMSAISNAGGIVGILSEEKGGKK